ncbi:16S rRNA (guanine(527)-N(7))-methyltransferase RsmG [Williamsia sterculiae]|uniref:Ribosomal RNA small subunit methyltransferase G n=1 Tax=Williamsia sterculiae TaxID=1344003 RepID=A0A1N7FG03_9NOCA|nr:16S rRNA (guanine(527)-N(7))-methyltransferase RsmG [Williamsia sterculiae]SIR99299.1 16S rRNA m(7)G-527 methyltransferase [Williamsia sterculiae]
MKHDSDATAGDVPAQAARVFGDRLPLAERYADLLATAGVERGLIGPREVPRIWSRHVLNCAVIGDEIGQALRVVDVGSGAGLPGIPLAIARPDLTVQLVEPLLRRVTFLEEVAVELGIDVEVVRGRAEERTVRRRVGEADVVTSRAVAPLDRLAAWSVPLLAAGGHMVAIKGRSAAEEIDTHRASTARLGLTALSVRSCGSAILDEPTTVIVGEATAHGTGKGRGRGSVRDRRGSGRARGVAGAE